MKGIMALNIPKGYEALGEVFEKALARAAFGKGKERHAADIKEFTAQISMQITREQGIGFPIGQARKKLHEAVQMLSVTQTEAKINELLDVIAYIGMAIIYLNEPITHSNANLIPNFPSITLPPSDKENTE